MASTLLLDTAAWDLCVDLDGNIAVASEPYALAQDAASAIRTFEGEVWYNRALGIPYWTQILGYAPPLSLMRAYFVAAALTVPDVVSAACFFLAITNRKVTGQVQITSTDGTLSAAAF